MTPDKVNTPRFLLTEQPWRPIIYFPDRAGPSILNLALRLNGCRRTKGLDITDVQVTFSFMKIA